MSVFIADGRLKNCFRYEAGQPIYLCISVYSWQTFDDPSPSPRHPQSRGFEVDTRLADERSRGGGEIGRALVGAFMIWTIELTLPYPISGNRYIGERVVPGKDGKKPFTLHYLTAEAKAFKAECQRIGRAAGATPILGPVEYEFELYPHLPLDWAKRARLDPVWWDLTVQCLDLDNARKVLLDALNGIAWTDDSRIRKDPGEIMIPDGEARCVIRIKPYERAHPQVSMFEGDAQRSLVVAQRKARSVEELPAVPF